MWLGHQLWSLHFWRFCCFVCFGFNLRLAFSVSSGISLPWGLHALFFLVRGQGKRLQLSTDWITMELSAEGHVLIGLDCSEPVTQQEYLISLGPSEPAEQGGCSLAHPPAGLSDGRGNEVREKASGHSGRFWTFWLLKASKVIPSPRLGLSLAAAAAKSLQSCPTLCDPIDGSPPGSPTPGILQARTLEWAAISFSNA